MSVVNTKLDWWINHNKNVLFVGRHGVGKTAMVKQAFDRHNLKWRYFSAATMDPWVDFIGCPREKTENALPEQLKVIKAIAEVNKNYAVSYIMGNWKLDEKAANEIISHCLHSEGVTYLDIVRPHIFASGEIEALFFDEFNRSPKKVRNAVMELIQLRSINGVKFPNLRFIWAAINPEEDNQLKYDVEVIDPAQLDRFEVAVNIPYKPNIEWFRQTYGQRVADSAIQWWDELSTEEKNNVSPRRLQYALDVYHEKGDMRDILPPSTNVSKLISSLNTGPISEKLAEFIQNDATESAQKFLENENNFSSAIKLIVKSDKLMMFFAPLMNSEKIASTMASEEKFCSFVINNIASVPLFHRIGKEILKANMDASLCKKIKRTLTENEQLADAFAKDVPQEKKLTEPKFHFNRNKNKNFNADLLKMNKYPTDTINQRLEIYDNIVNNIPEKITNNEAIEVLKLLNKIIGKCENICDTKDKDSWKFASILVSPAFEKLIPTINHCVRNINQEDSVLYENLISVSGELFIKIQRAGLSHQLIKENNREQQ